MNDHLMELLGETIPGRLGFGYLYATARHRLNKVYSFDAKYHHFINFLHYKGLQDLMNVNNTALRAQVGHQFTLRNNLSMLLNTEYYDGNVKAKNSMKLFYFDAEVLAFVKEKKTTTIGEG